MRHRDLAWRGLGATIFAAAALLKFSNYGDAVGLQPFFFALLGILLMVQGRRVLAALRIELSRHRLLARAIHDRRRQRSSRAKT